jgi:hypothetical protein
VADELDAEQSPLAVEVEDYLAGAALRARDDALGERLTRPDVGQVQIPSIYFSVPGEPKVHCFIAGTWRLAHDPILVDGAALLLQRAHDQRVDQWPSTHFSLANALDDRPTDLAHLLRRVATELDRRGIQPLQILDMTISSQITADGPWWSATLYWSPTDAPSQPGS